MIITLTKPITYKDKQLNTLDLDLSQLTGRDLLDAEDSLKAQGVSVPAWEYSRAFLLEVAAKSLHIPPEVLRELSASDFTRMINEVLAFLAGSASQDSTDNS